jgi:Flp pilus assembly protein TadG
MIALARLKSRGVVSRCLRRFAKARSGLAAVEFAMLVPVLMTLYLGCVEVTTAVATQRKVTLTAHALADLPSRFTAVTNADMSNILAAASDIIVPYAAAQLKSVISELAIDANGQATVVWSDTLNGTARTVGSVVNIPTNLAVANTYLLLGETQYSYNPSYGYAVTGTLTLSEQIFMRPRQSNSVARNNS